MRLIAAAVVSVLVLAGCGEKEEAPPPLGPAGEVTAAARATLEAGPSTTEIAVAGIHLSDIPTLDYQRHLFRERTLTSVTANTRADGEEFLRLASAVGIAPKVTEYAFQDADRALDDLAQGALTGAAVLDVS